MSAARDALACIGDAPQAAKLIAALNTLTIGATRLSDETKVHPCTPAFNGSFRVHDLTPREYEKRGEL